MPPDSVATSGGALHRRVRIRNPQGFHMRPATAFAQVAAQFESTVTLAKEDRKVNGKSLWELMLLGAEQGTELTLEVSGKDAATALDALAAIVEAPDADDIPVPPPKG
jgi:phosphotransferase system HPr (HPr) family protein